MVAQHNHIRERCIYIEIKQIKNISLDDNIITMEQFADNFYHSTCLQLWCEDDDRSCADVIRISPSRDQENDSRCRTL